MVARISSTTKVTFARLTALYLIVGFFYGFTAQDTNNATYEIFRTKVLRAERVQGGRRILLVGGSNVIWGFRSQIFEENLNVPATNLALPSEAGDPKVMRDLALSVVRKGDIVIYSSISFWNLSGYDAVGAQALLKAAGLYSSQNPIERFRMTVGRYWAFYPQGGSLAHNLPGLYRRYIGQEVTEHFSAYNEYGDLKACTATRVEPQGIVAPPDREVFLSTLAQFQDEIYKRGAEMVFDVSWLLVNERERQQWIDSFQALFLDIKAKFVVATNNLGDALLTDPVIFCDTVNHLADLSAVDRSWRLAKFLTNFLSASKIDLAKTSSSKNEL